MKNLVIDKNAILSNIKAVKEKAGPQEIIADLSGDAYGLGLVDTAMLLRDEGIRNFIISDPKDALALRGRGLMEETIMMARSTADSDELLELIDLGVVCTVGSYDAAVAINGIAEERHTVCEVMIKIDTGLGRYGFMPSEVDKIASVYRYMSGLAIVGVFTTFSNSAKSKRNTLAQYNTFRAVLDELLDMGLEVGTTFCFDSAALFKYTFGSEMNAVCIGPAFSGRIPGASFSSLKKVGYISASLEEVGWFPKGHKVGDGTTLKKPTKLAVISVGYYHGYGVVKFDAYRSFFTYLIEKHRRKIVRINGQRARTVGHIGMMHTVVDVTDIDCSVGDIAVMEADPLDVKSLPIVYTDAVSSVSEFSYGG